MADRYDPLREEPFDSLREGWRALVAPDPTPQVPDEMTRAAVAWMRDAWRTLDAPALRTVPGQMGRRASFLPLRVGLAAAAAALVLAFVAPIVPRDRAPADDTQLVARPLQIEVPEQRDLAPEEGVLELRQGSVRLLFLMPDQETER